MPRVILAMSGGVDSSVAASLLLRAGHEVIGVFMRHGMTLEQACAVKSESEVPSENERSALPIVSQSSGQHQGCCGAADAADARRVADRLEIPFYSLNLDREFGQIMDYFVAEYVTGRTPNPCVMCNNQIKFGKLFEYADAVGAEFVATGHYARLDTHPAPRLRRGIDAGKDQSYVLFGIDRRMLPRMLLPVGEYRKSEIRSMARELGLRVAEKKDSQEICFVPTNDHAEFVAARRGARVTSGEFVTTDGQVVGRHSGIERFTVGQRKGLGIALGEPRFVVRIDPDTNRVYLGSREELRRDEFTARNVNWLVDPIDAELDCHVQIRYNSPAVLARVTVLEDQRIRVRFREPKGAVAPGQAAVIYRGEQVLGGGWIE